MAASTRTFCCCIPTRVGVVVIATIGLLGGGALAIGGALNAHKIQGSKAPIAISIVIYSLLGLLSLLGLIGALGRKLTLIRVYGATLVAHLVLSFIVGVYALCRIFKDGKNFIDHCVAANQNMKDVNEVCAEGLKAVKGTTIALFIIVWLFEIYGCVIVKRYKDQLEDEKMQGGAVKDTEAW